MTTTVLPREKPPRESRRTIAADPEDVYHVLRHLAANDPSIRASGDEPGAENFSRIK